MDESAAELLYRHKVMRLLQGEGLLSEERTELLLSWRHTGFSVHNRVRVESEDQPAGERLARYIMDGCHPSHCCIFEPFVELVKALCERRVVASSPDSFNDPVVHDVRVLSQPEKVPVTLQRYCGRVDGRVRPRDEDEDY